MSKNNKDIQFEMQREPLRIFHKDRILLHLAKYPNILHERFNLPFAVTQDGIGFAIGKKRAHCSLMLTDNPYVEFEERNIKGGRSKRKAYQLTPQGITHVNELIKKIKSYGEDPDNMISSFSDVHNQNIKLNDAMGYLEESFYLIGTGEHHNLKTATKKTAHALKLMTDEL